MLWFAHVGEVEHCSTTACEYRTASARRRYNDAGRPTIFSDHKIFLYCVELHLAWNWRARRMRHLATAESQEQTSARTERDPRNTPAPLECATTRRACPSGESAVRN